jgi:hypothetical protein
MHLFLNNLETYRDQINLLLSVLLLIATTTLIVVGALQAKAAQAQAKAAEAQALAAATQLNESIRPILVLEKLYAEFEWSSSEQSYAVRNVGLGVATQVRIEVKAPDDANWKNFSEVPSELVILPAGQVIPLGKSIHDYLFHYDSLTGKKYYSWATANSTAPVMVFGDIELLRKSVSPTRNKGEQARTLLAPHKFT